MMKMDLYSGSPLLANYIGVFWDIENCNIPRGKSALEICEKIRNLDFFYGYTEVQFAVACDATKESSYILDELQKSQVGGEYVEREVV